MLLTLNLVRHGEIDSNLGKVYSGRSIEPLNASGRKQAVLAAQAMIGQGIRVLFSSPILRAQQTAEIIAGVIGAFVVTSKAFTELGMGPWEGMAESEVAHRYPMAWKTWTEHPANLVLPGRERLEDVRARILPGLKEIADRQRGDGVPVILVSHVAVIRILLMHARGMDLNLYKSIHVPNAKPMRIILNADDFTEAH